MRYKLFLFTILFSLVIFSSCSDDDLDVDWGDGDIDSTEIDELQEGETNSESDNSDSETDIEKEIDEQQEAEEVQENEQEKTDEKSPEITSILVEIKGDYSLQSDLNSKDLLHYMPATTEIKFVVQVSDDISDTENLTVVIVEADDNTKELSGVTTKFNQGLWNVTFYLSAGKSIQVKVTDEADNSATSQYKLTIPSKLESLAGEWQTEYYDAREQVDYKLKSTWKTDKTWEETREDTKLVHGGNYEEDAGNLKISETYNNGNRAGDSDKSTIEWEKVGAYYVDKTYFSASPYKPSSAGTGLEGIWTYDYKYYENKADKLELMENAVKRYTFNDDKSWTLQVTGEDYKSGSKKQITITHKGTYEIKKNDGYLGGYGDLLIKTITEKDGTTLGVAETEVDLFVIRGGKLLISPAINERK